MELVGHGIDVVELARIAESLRSSADDFLEATFTEAERGLAEESADPPYAFQFAVAAADNAPVVPADCHAVLGAPAVGVPEVVAHRAAEAVLRFDPVVGLEPGGLLLTPGAFLRTWPGPGVSFGRGRGDSPRTTHLERLRVARP